MVVLSVVEDHYKASVIDLMREEFFKEILERHGIEFLFKLGEELPRSYIYCPK